MQENKQEKSPIKRKILLFLSENGISQYDFYRKRVLQGGFWDKIMVLARIIWRDFLLHIHKYRSNGY